MGDGSPICSDLSKLNKLVLKALTKNQILLLKEIEKNFTKTITSLANKLSKTTKIPLSTLKLNARILKELDLIEYINSNPVELTDSGKLVLILLSDQNGK